MKNYGFVCYYCIAYKIIDALGREFAAVKPLYYAKVGDELMFYIA